jgi:hypothetical protein
MRESLGGKPRRRNESESREPCRVTPAGCIGDRSGYSLKDLSKSVSVGTRKMVIYA